MIVRKEFMAHSPTDVVCHFDGSQRKKANKKKRKRKRPKKGTY